MNEIGDGAFGCNLLLTEVNLPESLQLIPVACFTFSISLSSFRVPSGVLTIAYRAFWGCKCLLSIETPRSLVRIGGECFLKCCELRNIVLPQTTIEVGPGAFSQCKKLQKHIGEDQQNQIIAYLKTRFDALPLHRFCYYHTYSVSRPCNLDELCESIDNKSNDDDTDTDCWDMTPLLYTIMNYALNIVPIIQHMLQRFYATQVRSLGLGK